MVFRRFSQSLLALLATSLLSSCDQSDPSPVNPLPSEEKIVNSPLTESLFNSGELQAIAYGSYRSDSRSVVASVEDIMEDLRILSALGYNMIRTYNTQQFDEVRRIFLAIEALKKEEPEFSMYVMLGVWIDCEGAFGEAPDHTREDLDANQREIDAAVEFAQRYPDIVKVIAVGNEAMVHWAATYFVGPEVILKWVEYLQSLKQSGGLGSGLWITSSDNFASWGGGDPVYRTPVLEQLIRAVDYVSLHTYPFHDTHYNPQFWQSGAGPDEAAPISDTTSSAIDRALSYAEAQFDATERYVHSIVPGKPLHIGETGWASADNRLYGEDGSGAAGEAAQAQYVRGTLAWTRSRGITAVLFEAFDEPWKDADNPGGSENHFGLMRDHFAKQVLWEQVDQGVLEGLRRGGQTITKSSDRENTL